MIFLIDVDGVVADLVGHTLRKLAKYYPANTLPSINDIRSEHDIFRSGQTPLTLEQLDTAHNLIEKPKYVQGLPVIYNARKGIRLIEERGHQIIWLTAPWLSSKTWDYDRRIWIRDNFDTPMQDVIMAHHKELVRGDVFIDDKLDHLNKWVQYNPNGKAFLYTQPWSAPVENKAIKHFQWNNIETLLKELE